MNVRYSIELDLPGNEAVTTLGKEVHVLCASHGWRLIGMGPVTSDPPCPQCGSPMVFDTALQTYVCHHAA